MTDRIAEIRRAAKKLLRHDSDHNERVQIRIDNGSALPIYIGRSFPARSFNAVIRSVDTADLPPHYRRPEIQGLSIYWVNTRSRAGSAFDIVMELLHADAVDVFFVFVARLCEVVEKCDDSKEALAEAIGQIELWRQFFADVANYALSDNRQTGLFGELTMLKMLITSGMDVAAGVTAWTGASAKNQDFEFKRAAIEVKSTTSVDATEIFISNLRQLDTTGLDCLYLARIALDVRQGNDNTLVALIADLRDRVLSEASQHKVDFEQKLLCAGYHDKYEDNYINRAYTLRDASFYLVRKDFPRIEQSELPHGVGRVKYSINLQVCEKHKEVDEIAIARVIRASG